MVTVASFNVENLFARPKEFNTGSWAAGERILRNYGESKTLIAEEVCSAADRDRRRELLVEHGVYAHARIRGSCLVAPEGAPTPERSIECAQAADHPFRAIRRMLEPRWKRNRVAPPAWAGRVCGSG